MRYPGVFAHRGGCALGPENTIAAFELGLGAGADGLEFDVHLSADGVVVVFHDALLDRTTDGSGPIAARTAAELARFDAGYRFASPAGQHSFRGQGVRIPTLREVLRRFPDTPVIIEMKVDRPEMGQRVVADLLAEDAVGRACVAGEGAACVRSARAALPSLQSSACRTEVRWSLFKTWAGLPLGSLPFVRMQVPEYAGAIRVVSPRFVRNAHAAGLSVEVWTVDEGTDMERLLGWGVDALITNRPDLAVRVRERWVEASGLAVSCR